MILVLNGIQDETARERFDRVTVPRLAAVSSSPVQIAHLADERTLPGPGGRTHLVISGSELSAAEPHERDAEIHDLVRGFVEADRPVLGICWGHQVLAKALAGDEVCRPAERPEFGWRAIEVADNPLFDGMAAVMSAHSHYDEVFDLPAAFEVIGWTEDCAVQAFQYDKRPVWGVQFHPEIAHEQGRAMFERRLREDPDLRSWFHDELDDPAQLDDNTRLFENFFASVTTSTPPTA